MTPEEKARKVIDRMFSDAGWKIVDRKHYSPLLSAAAIEEGLLNGNLEADYLLFLGGKAVGVLEAKKEGVNLLSDKVTSQAENYVKEIPLSYQTIIRPLPLIYLSDGRSVYFKDCRTPDIDYVQINRIHTPKEVVSLLGIEDEFSSLPALSRKGLRDCQYEAVTKLEESFREGKRRALMVLATGAGKTYTACLASYRMLSYTPMRRVLFLVDRNNLGKQAEGEFGMFRLTENGDAFNTIFGVERLKSARIPKDANVVISTIQRLFSLLSGQEIIDTDDDTDDSPETPVTLPQQLTLPPDYFDLIIIDECHRSIYGNWKAVLDYFTTARLIGLTATPVPETLAFFNNNRIVNYTLEKSIADGVNVDHRVYRIKTKQTEDGGAIREGEKVKEITRYTGEVETIENKETKNYTKTELNRSIVNPAQIKLVLETYRDAIYSELYPERDPNPDFIPKTLIFALNDAHASNIVKIDKEVFGRSDDEFVQKITYSAGDSNALIRDFRNKVQFRIAVTVTLVATGTDVKPLEVVMFMRDVESEPLYVQMKGRGVRTIGDDQLRNVTPNALSKDMFYLVDAVGVTEHDKTIAHPATGPRSDTISLAELLEKITHGNVGDDYLRTLASRLSRLYAKCKSDQKTEFARLSGKDIKDIAVGIFNALEGSALPPYNDINEPNTERKVLVENIANYPEAREYLLKLNAGFITILQPGEDTLIYHGFSVEEAQRTTAAFEAYVQAHKDEMEALRIIYNNTGEALTYQMMKDLERELLYVNVSFGISKLWNLYAILNPALVSPFTGQDERNAITNIIQLVRYAYHKLERLESLYPEAQSRFNLWYGQVQRDITEDQVNLLRQVVDYIASNGSLTIKDIKEDNQTRAAQIVQSFGGAVGANAALASLSKFILFRQVA